MKHATFIAGLIQMRCSNNAAESLAHATDLLREAAKRGVQVACLPELFLTHYFCQSEDPDVFNLAESIPGPTTQALSALAKETKMVIIGSIFERQAAGVYYNTAVVLDADGELKGIYRKMHIPDDPHYYEKYYFAPGDLGFKMFGTRYGNIGTLVCWDQWYPEAARLTAMMGADMLFYPTAIGWHPKEKAEWGKSQREAWITSQRAHAIANGIYVGAVNRIGHEPPPKGVAGDGIEFFGSSFIYDPYGRPLAEGSTDKEEILIATIDPAMNEEKRRHWPHFRDRRIDAYGALLQRWGKA